MFIASLWNGGCGLIVSAASKWITTVGFQHSQQRRLMEDPCQAGMPSTFPFYPAAAPHRPEGTGEAQQRVFRLLSRQERCEAGLCVSSYLVRNLLQYDTPRSQGRSAWGSLPYIQFHTYWSMFNLQRLLARAKTMEELILDLLFVDDCALLAHTEEALQVVVNCFAQASKAFGLTIDQPEENWSHASEASTRNIHPTLDWHQGAPAQHTGAFHVPGKCHLKWRNHGQGCQQPPRQS